MQTIDQAIKHDPILKQFDQARQNLWHAYAEEQAIDVDKLAEMLAVLDTCARERRQEVCAQFQRDAEDRLAAEVF